MHVGVKVINLLLSLYSTLYLSNFEKNWILKVFIAIMEYKYTLFPKAPAKTGIPAQKHFRGGNTDKRYCKLSLSF